MLQATGKFQRASKSQTGIIFIPADIVVDSCFPFKDPSKVRIRIDGARLIVDKAEVGVEQ
jgi:hypothetical protein